MKENITGGQKDTHPFFIEAAINEEGPKKLKVVPLESGFEIFHEDKPLGKIRQSDDEWKQTEGELSPGVINLIGRIITAYYR